MKQTNQTCEEIVDSLSPLDVDWMDEMATATIAKLTDLPHKEHYGRDDIATLLDGKFEVGILCARLFLALSKDKMEEELRRALGPTGIGSQRFKHDRDNYLAALEALELPQAMKRAIHYKPVWSDIFIERLRTGRGSAIQGQKRGRGLEDFAEALVKEVFGEDGYRLRGTFIGAGGNTAKCDIAIPNLQRPNIIIEIKAYGATGSKMTDILGDLEAIIAAKRRDSALLFVTDGTTWEARLSDLRKIVHLQNEGNVTRIYTTKMREQFLDDLRTLKSEFGI